MSQHLKEIKPFIEISDYSLILLVLTLLFALFIAYKLFKIAYHFAKRNCKVNCQKYYFYIFSNIDWSNPKEAAYLATKYGAVLANDKRKKELFAQLRDKLDKYKYKKDIKSVDKETLNYYNLYKQVCDESL
jgi:hypothetical protein